MPHNLDLILLLTVGLGTALLFGLAALRLKMPAIVGYLLAGILIGPHTPGFVGNRELADQAAEIGVILLMFGVGLHFHLKDLLAVRKVALTGALCQITVATLLGALAGRAFGWSWPAGIVFGVALSVASTVVLTRVLSDHGDLDTRTGRVAIGWLVVEDIFTVFVLVVLPVVFGSAQQDTSNLGAAVGMSALKLGALTAIILGAGGKVIPRFLANVARTRSREIFTLAVLVIALGISVGAAKLFGVSMALGAFLAGMVVGQSEFSYRAASEALPMRDAFAVLFFVSVGMLFDPAHLVREPVFSLITTAIVLVAKPLAAFAIVILLGYGAKIGLRAAVALAQIGEFSFLLAAVGDDLKILPPGGTDSLIAASIVTITLNPLLYGLIPRMEKSLMQHLTLRRLLRPRMREEAEFPEALPSTAEKQRTVVVGYGPVGQTLVRLLKQRDVEPVVIDLNFDAIHAVRSHGLAAVYGDAARSDILEQAGVAEAAALILAAPLGEESAEVIRTARKLNPHIVVLARSSFVRQGSALREAGADEVFSGEAEVALAMTDSLLTRLGATPDQLEEEMQSLRAKLYEATAGRSGGHAKSSPASTR